mmetsp:Transcript_25703/g.41443  ORF Transcript_25703/g.41443 Transcript_25703/m.41443 type:complete len:1038 (-) Transcript_25703:3169-6282(-)
MYFDYVSEEACLQDAGNGCLYRYVDMIVSHKEVSCDTKNSKSKAHDFKDLESGFDAEFQRLMKRADNGTEELFSKLSRLISDFQYAALTYGKIIISEKHLDVAEKSIKPQDHLGGYAGGEKFVVSNIFFRLPVDQYNLYGGEDFAAKEANHQLKGLTALYNADIELSLPLLAVIHYQGYKLVAMSVLPIQGQRTLCYGSSDGLRDGLKADRSVLSLMDRTAQQLNLRKHPVQAGQNGETQWTSMPCDMEVHKVAVNENETRWYALDFGRLFPPMPDNYRTLKGSHLFYLMRPEFVMGHHTSLSSDAYTRFGSSLKCHEEYNRDVWDAKERLLNETIPNLAKELDNNIKPGEMTFSNRLHEKGVNMRLLGVLFRHVESAVWRREILLEATARVIKAHIRCEMRRAPRNVRTAVLSPLVLKTRALLNRVLGRTKCSSSESRQCGCLDGTQLAKNEDQARQLWWCHRLPIFLKERFWFDLDPGVHNFRSMLLNLANEYPKPTCLCCVCLWKKCVPPARLFARVQNMTGIELSETTQRSLDSQKEDGFSFLPQARFERTEPFDEHDIVNFREQIKVLPIMEYAQGTLAMMRAKSCTKQGLLEEANHLKQVAAERFRLGLSIYPLDHRLLCNLGLVVECHNEDDSLQYYLRAVKFYPNHARPWFFLARFLSSFLSRHKSGPKLVQVVAAIRAAIGNHLESSHGLANIIAFCFQRACLLDPDNLDFCVHYADYYGRVLTSLEPAEREKHSGMAQKMYRKVLDKQTQNTMALEHLADLLLKDGSLLRKNRAARGPGTITALCREKIVESIALFERLPEPRAVVDWTVAQAKLTLYVLDIQSGEKPDWDLVLSAVNHARAGFAKVEACLAQPRLHSQQVRFFEVEDHLMECKKACNLLVSVGKKFTIAYVGCSAGHKLDLQTSIDDCFKCAAKFSTCGIAKQQLCTVYHTHAECLLKLNDPEFSFDKSTRDINHLRRNSEGSLRGLWHRRRSLNCAGDSVFEQSIFEVVEHIFRECKLCCADIPRLKLLTEKMYLQYRCHFFSTG